MKPRSSLVAVDSVAVPASSQFGAPPFLSDGPLSLCSLPEPSGSIEDGDNFDSSILPPNDCHTASNDDTYSFDYPYGDDLSSTSLPIEHHPEGVEYVSKQARLSTADHSLIHHFCPVILFIDSMLADQI